MLPAEAVAEVCGLLELGEPYATLVALHLAVTQFGPLMPPQVEVSDVRGGSVIV